MALFLHAQPRVLASDITKFSGYMQLWDNWSDDFLSRKRSRRGSAEARMVFSGAAIAWFKNDGKGGSKIVAFFDMRNRVRVWDDVLWEPIRG